MDSFKKQFAVLFDLSAEIVLELPLIMLIGQEKLYIENHQGIITYCSEEIKIKVKDRFIFIKGQELFIEEIKTDLLFITGLIEEIFYEDR